jgi:hypothetical protein
MDWALRQQPYAEVLPVRVSVIVFAYDESFQSLSSAYSGSDAIVTPMGGIHRGYLAPCEQVLFTPGFPTVAPTVNLIQPSSSAGIRGFQGDVDVFLRP